MNVLRSNALKNMTLGMVGGDGIGPIVLRVSPRGRERTKDQEKKQKKNNINYLSFVPVLTPSFLL